MRKTNVLPTRQDMEKHSDDLYGDVRKHGWRVRMMHRFGYFGSEAWYEATVDKLVTEGCSWLDVGGGKAIFPDNKRLSEALSRRCGLLVGVDPSDNIASNPYVYEAVKCRIDEYESDRKFDVVTLRMVAEHIENPKPAVESLSRLMTTGGTVVIFTPNRWSPVSVAASIIPFSLHQPITHFLWGTKQEDVFPTVYKMNTRRQLRTLFEDAGFAEIAFSYLDNCSTFQRFRASCFLELSLWWVLRKVRLRYPENNLLGVYEKAGTPA
ncbi:MAG: class I SAM-dependent methyltransferase [Planctomycetia bacterium]|nr:class I SAM-dependent methyltransferase [Planctomycetia bacterium]